MPNRRKINNIPVLAPILPNPKGPPRVPELTGIRQIFRIAGYGGSDEDLDLMMDKWVEFRDELNRVGHEYIFMNHFLEFIWQNCQRWFATRIIQTLKDRDMI